MLNRLRYLMQRDGPDQSLRSDHFPSVHGGGGASQLLTLLAVQVRAGEQLLCAERRAPTAERREPTAERQPPSAERLPQSAERRPPSA